MDEPKKTKLEIYREFKDSFERELIFNTLLSGEPKPITDIIFSQADALHYMMQYLVDDDDQPDTED